jgi:hypothetical protein
MDASPEWSGSGTSDGDRRAAPAAAFGVGFGLTSLT